VELDGSNLNETPAAVPEEPPSLRRQIGATITAIKRLVRSHVDLAKAEVGEIVDEVKRMVALGAAALAALLLVGLLFTLGGLLFLGEWLFGSIGWGVLLGTFLLLDLAVVALLLALDVSGSRIGNAFVIGAIIGLIVGVPLALDLGHRAWVAAGDAVVPGYDPSTRTVLLAVGIVAAIGAVLGFLAGLRGGFGRAIGGLIGGGILGAGLGLLTSVSIPGTVGAAIGVLVWLLAWPALAGRDVMRTGVDGEALMRKFTPKETIELTKETIEWVRARTPLVPKS
jgi:hypothetical protein